MILAVMLATYPEVFAGGAVGRGRSVQVRHSTSSEAIHACGVDAFKTGDAGPDRQPESRRVGQTGTRRFHSPRAVARGIESGRVRPTSR